MILVTLWLVFKHRLLDEWPDPTRSASLLGPMIDSSSYSLPEQQFEGQAVCRSYSLKNIIFDFCVEILHISSSIASDFLIGPERNSIGPTNGDTGDLWWDMEDREPVLQEGVCYYTPSHSPIGDLRVGFGGVWGATSPNLTRFEITTSYFRHIHATSDGQSCKRFDQNHQIGPKFNWCY